MRSLNILVSIKENSLLKFSLKKILKDLNRVIKKPYIEEKDLTGKIVTEEQAAEGWKNYLMRNKSVVVDLFQVKNE
jgi:ubiquitin carboxyl-terminal hydrolase 8